MKRDGHPCRWHARGRIGADEQRFVVRAVRDIAADVSPAPEGAASATGIRVLGVPARPEADETALSMLGHLLAAAGIGMEVVAPDLLSAEVVRDARERHVAVLVIAALPPGGLAQARHLAKRLRAALPEVKIVVGRWCVREDLDAMREALTGAGADAVGTSLLETRELVAQLVPRAAATAGRAA